MLANRPDQCVFHSFSYEIVHFPIFYSMMMACFTGHVNVAITLKEHGASLKVKDQGGTILNFLFDI